MQADPIGISLPIEIALNLLFYWFYRRGGARDGPERIRKSEVYKEM